MACHECAKDADCPLPKAKCDKVAYIIGSFIRNDDISYSFHTENLILILFKTTVAVIYIQIKNITWLQNTYGSLRYFHFKYLTAEH